MDQISGFEVGLAPGDQIRGGKWVLIVVYRGETLQFELQDGETLPFELQDMRDGARCNQRLSLL